MNVLQRGIAVHKSCWKRLLYVDAANSCMRQCQQYRTEQITGKESIDQVVDDLWEKACQRDVMVRSLPKQKICMDLKQLINLGCPESKVGKIFEKLDSLKQLADIIEHLKTLLDHGFNVEQASSILSSMPNLSNLVQEDIVSCISKLQKMGLSSKSCVSVVEKYPKILLQDISQIDTRIADLKQIFKTKDALNLIEQNPQILYCDWKYISERFNYIFCEMGITQRQMLNTSLFSYAMDHIYARHMFVVRAGFFKKVKKKGEQIDTNPSLDMIIDTSDKEFSKQFGNMTVQDYKTFKQLLLREQTTWNDIEEEAYVR